MIPRITGFLVGICWIIGGAMMVIYPPPHDFYRGPMMPVVGWVGLAGGIYISAKSLLTSHVEATNKRLPDTDSSSAAERKLSMWRIALCALVSAYAIWSGVSRGLLSLVGLGVLCSSFVFVGLVARRYGPFYFLWPR